MEMFHSGHKQPSDFLLKMVLIILWICIVARETAHCQGCHTHGMALCCRGNHSTRQKGRMNWQHTVTIHKIQKLNKSNYHNFFLWQGRILSVSSLESIRFANYKTYYINTQFVKCLQFTFCLYSVSYVLFGVTFS